MRGGEADVPNGDVRQLTPFLVTAERAEKFPAWAVWAIGAGVVIFGGLVGYQAWRKQKRRR